MAQLTVTEDIRAVLCSAAACPTASKEVQDGAASSVATGTVAWSTLKAAVHTLREVQPQTHAGLKLHTLCCGSSLAFQSPPPRLRSPQLEARIAELQLKLDDKRYAAMVEDVTSSERAAEARQDGILPTTRLQMGFGIQVLVTMGTFFALAYVSTKYYLGWDELWAGLTGAIGLTFGLLLETLLLILRSNMPPPLRKQYPHLFVQAQQPAAGVNGKPAAESQPASIAEGKKRR